MVLYSVDNLMCSGANVMIEVSTLQLVSTKAVIITAYHFLTYQIGYTAGSARFREVATRFENSFLIAKVRLSTI
jgi:hypothetical protein